MLIMKEIFKSILKSTKVFILKKRLQKKIFKIQIKLDFVQAIIGHIGL